MTRSKFKKPEGFKHPIDADFLRSILTYDRCTGIFRWRKATNLRVDLGGVAGSPDKTGYLRISIFRRKYFIHRLAWLYETGEWPAGKLDHRDHDKTNNAIDNLRLASNSQNITNRRSFGRIKPRGVTKIKSGYTARITMHRVVEFLGLFETEDEAAHAYNKAAIVLHGDFAVLNPIGGDHA